MKLLIKDMTCEHCAAAVRDALTDVDGVIQVTAVDLDTGTADVEGNPEGEALVAAVEAQGYTAQLAS